MISKQEFIQKTSEQIMNECKIDPAMIKGSLATFNAGMFIWLTRLSEEINVFVVGGFIRDVVWGFESNDVDVAFEGSVENLIAAINKIGSEHATIKEQDEVFPGCARLIVDVHCFDERVQIEMTQCRKEITTGMGKKDVTFEPATIVDDLKRRDFLPNSVGFDIANECMIDPLGGLEDLFDRKLTLGPNFHESAERVNRFFTFIARFDFVQIDCRAMPIIKSMLDSGSAQHVNAEQVGMHWLKLVNKGTPKGIVSAHNCMFRRGVLPEPLNSNIHVLNAIQQHVDASNTLASTCFAILKVIGKHDFMRLFTQDMRKAKARQLFNMAFQWDKPNIQEFTTRCGRIAQEHGMQGREIGNFQKAAWELANLEFGGRKFQSTESATEIANRISEVVLSQSK